MTTQAEFFSQKQLLRKYKTVEVYHPTIGVRRYVSGRIDPINFTLESDAPRNASESVEFTGAGFEWSRPNQNESYVTADISFGRIGSELKQILKQIKGANRSLTGDVVLREFVGQDLIYAVRLYIGQILIGFDNCTIKVQQDNPAGRSVASIYTADKFQGLAESL
jgi:hypothetical protein